MKIIFKKIKKPTYLFLSLLLIASVNYAQNLAGSRPNIIVVMPDDISFGEHSFYGDIAQTPNINQLLEQGQRLSNFHVSPTCAPTRASLLTGRHEFYSGITHTIFMRDQMALNQKILPEILKENGYATAMFGKWHLGDAKAYRPKQRGFDEVLQHGGGGITQNYDHSADFPNNHYNDPVLLYNEKVIQEEGYCTDIFFDYAMNWMKKEKNSKKPFFAYIPTNTVHGPHEPPKGKEGKSSIIENLDENVGRLMQFLHNENLSENTLLIYFTDNGSQGAKAKGLRAGKGSATEGGILVPAVFYWKGKIENSGLEIDQLTGHIDMYKTLAALAGDTRDFDKNQLWDGKNIVPLLENPENYDLGERYFVGHRSRWKTGVADDYQYAEASIQNDRFKLYFTKKGEPSLYDLDNDLGEKIDISSQYPKIYNELFEQYNAFWKDARTYMINDTINAPEIHKPFHELYKESFGESAFNEAYEAQLNYEAKKKEEKKKNKQKLKK